MPDYELSAPAGKKPGRGSIIVVDDDEELLGLLRELLDSEGFSAASAASAEEAQKVMAHRDFDVALVDLHLPGMDGFAFIEWLDGHRPVVVPVVISAGSSMDDAISAVRSKAFDFIVKPVEDYDWFFRLLDRAVEYRRAVVSRDALLEELQSQKSELENRLRQLSLAHQALKESALAIGKDLTRARRIQRALLPKEVPYPDKVALSALYIPSGKVGGDLFDVFPLSAGRLGVYVADVSGHGVSSALLTVYLKDAVHAFERRGEDRLLLEPARVLTRLNRMVCDDLGSLDMFISVTYLVLDTETGLATFANAGHPPLLLRDGSGSVRTVEMLGPALGIDEKARYDKGRVELTAGDMLALYTDGLRDIVDGDGRAYGVERLAAKFAQSECHADIMASEIEKDLVLYRNGTELPDDVTLLVLGLEPQRFPFIVEPQIPDDPDESERLPTDCFMATAASADRCFVVVGGSGTWKDGARFREVIDEAVSSKQCSVVIDFSNCAHLDSTFLGILHDVVGKLSGRGVTIELQNIQRPLLREMSELGLTSVLNHVRQRPLSVPGDLHRVSGVRPAPDEMGRLLISAHEALIDADPRNADRFDEVLKVLYGKLAEH